MSGRKQKNRHLREIRNVMKRLRANSLTLLGALANWHEHPRETRQTKIVLLLGISFRTEAHDGREV